MEDFSDMGQGNGKKKNKDRISELTDELLLKIMSFLNTKHAVQTCVLSKRWKKLWESLRYLDFNYNTFPFKRKIVHLDHLELEMKMCSFSNFISQVLFRRDSYDLVKVCVQSPNYNPHASVLAGLICYAVKHNVQHLTFQLNFRGGLPFSLPQSLYTCQSLTSLELKRNDWMAIELPTLLACRALKSLHLSHFSMAGPNFEPTAFSGCPNLETLQLFDIVPESENLCINADKLRSLVLSFALLIDGKVEIYAPRLTTFKYSGILPMVCLTDNLASVDDVYFDIRTPRFIHNEEEYVIRLINTFKEFPHAKSLTLSTSTIKVLSKFPSLVVQNRLPFANLKHLNIKLKKWQRKRFEMPACILNYFLNRSSVLKICMDSEMASYDSSEDSD
ncbi:PREDICTED: F-box/LRR-repeat protein At3g26922 [Theobroma cacao]|uniref:F-box/LRR-repeat protein At3g26922 n=1 Tax=Theobroma cacao TaxID=3641 RepID=A0AB32UN25_THECC|nr:PREDICTED: F-box/LRR-repeat protein At3g26922 [Theobroma cacao]